jgi:aryl-alcohol dehydrogenase-like predicted oxidoreductase
MQNRPFGRTGVSVSPLGFGGAPIGFLETERSRVATLLNGLLDAGVNLIDTAAGYRGSEEFIADAIGARRDQFVLVSKCGNKVDGLDAEPWSPQLIAATVDRSLRRLRTDRLDVMLLHSCGRDVLERGEALAALVRAREAGKIRHAGYSGDNEAAEYAATLPDVAVIETSVNVADQRNLDVVVPVCMAHNVGVLAKRPIANAAWKDLDQQPGFYKGYAKTYTDRFAQMLATGLDPNRLGFAGPRDWPEIALRFTLSHPGVHCGIIGTTNPDNARANVAYANKGPLPAAGVSAIRDAFKRAQGGETWTGQT